MNEDRLYRSLDELLPHKEELERHPKNRTRCQKRLVATDTGGSSVHSAAAGQSIREMIEEADADLLVVIKEMRDAARAADESNDPGTVDLFSRIVQIHEKHKWFLREILKKKDGVEA